MRAKGVVRAVMTMLCCAAVARDARATSFNAGDFETFIQDDFGDASTPAGMLLGNRFTNLYGAAGYVEIGVPGAAGFSMLFTSASATYTYLSASGLPAPLNADLVDPTTSASGLLGGEVLGLRFNVDLSDAGYTGSLGLRFGDLIIHDYTGLPQCDDLRWFVLSRLLCEPTPRDCRVRRSARSGSSHIGAARIWGCGDDSAPTRRSFRDALSMTRRN